MNDPQKKQIGREPEDIQLKNYKDNWEQKNGDKGGRKEIREQRKGKGRRKQVAIYFSASRYSTTDTPGQTFSVKEYGEHL